MAQVKLQNPNTLVQGLKPKDKNEVKAHFTNNTQEYLSFFKNKDWVGHGNFPSSIKPNGVPTFFDNEIPVKAGIVYKGQNQNGEPCAWLLAFCALGEETKLKVYVEAGKLPNYNHVNWKNIEEKLDEADEKSHYKDPATGCSADASIEYCPLTNGVRLGALFGDNNIA